MGPLSPTKGPFSPDKGPFQPDRGPLSTTEGPYGRQRALKIGRGQTGGPSQTDRGPFQPTEGPSRTDRGPFRTFLSRQKTLPDRQRALRFGEERTGGPSQVDRGPSGSEKGPPVVLCHAKLSSYLRPTEDPPLWAEDGVFYKSDRRTAETLKKKTMKDHLGQTGGLMRPIGCSLRLTGSLNSKEASPSRKSKSAPEPQGRTRGYPGYPPPWIRL